ncbi:MAG: O-antigen ligase family protein [Myxococcota bacterium]
MGAVHAPVILSLFVLACISLGCHVFQRQSVRIHAGGLLLLASVLLTFLFLMPAPLAGLVPQKSALRFMQLATALILFVVLSDNARDPKARQIIWNGVLLSGIALFFIAAAHRLFGAERIWGSFGSAQSYFFAPLVNPNSLGRLFGIFALLCLARVRKWPFAVVAVLCGASVFMTQTRFGAIAFVCCALWMAILKRRGAAVVLGMGVFALLVAGAAAFSDLATLVSPGAYEFKLDILKHGLGMIGEHWLMGIGPGATAFEFHHDVQPDFLADSLFSFYYQITYLENTTLQLLLDHGLVKGALLGLIALWTVVQIYRRQPEYAVVLTFIWIADWADFSLETGAVLYLSALVLALSELPWRVTFSPKAMAMCLVCISGAGIWAQVVARQPDWTDPSKAYVQGMRALELGDRRLAQAWFEYSLRQRPTFYAAHLQLARLLNSKEHYRLAIASNPGALPGILLETKGLRDVLPVINAQTLMALCKQLIVQGQNIDALECINEALAFEDKTPDDVRFGVEYALAHDSPKQARFWLDGLLPETRQDGEAAVLAARIVGLEKGTLEALEESAGWLKGLKTPCPLAIWRINAFAGLKLVDEAEAALRKYQGCSDDPERFEASLYEQTGFPARALRIIRKISAARPEDAELKNKRVQLEKEVAGGWWGF